MKLSILVDGEWCEIGDCEASVEEQVDENIVSVQPVSANIRLDWSIAKSIIDLWYNAELKAAGRLN